MLRVRLSRARVEKLANERRKRQARGRSVHTSSTHRHSTEHGNRRKKNAVTRAEADGLRSDLFRSSDSQKVSLHILEHD